MQSLRTVTAPPAYPITRAEAKTHLRVDTTDDDTLIDAYIAAATDWAEQYCNRRIIRQDVELTRDCLPSSGKALELPGGQVQSITSITYRDSDDALQTWSSAEYISDLSSEPARVEAAHTYTYPYARERVGSVKVRYYVGYTPGDSSPTDYAANVPNAIKTAIKLHVEAQYDRDKDQMLDLIEVGEALLWPYRIC